MVRVKKSYTSVMFKVVAAATTDEARVNHVAFSCPLKHQPTAAASVSIISRMQTLMNVFLERYIMKITASMISYHHSVLVLTIYDLRAIHLNYLGVH